MLYDTPGEKFLDDPEYVADAIVAASSELPCPSCLTGLMEVCKDGLDLTVPGEEPTLVDVFKCGSCSKHVFIERHAS